MIKELGPGDEVFSLDEATKQIEIARVVGQRCSGEKEVFEITARGRTIGASVNHPFLVLRDERSDRCASTPAIRARGFRSRSFAVGDLVAIATDLPEYGDCRAAPCARPTRRGGASRRSRRTTCAGGPASTSVTGS